MINSINANHNYFKFTNEDTHSIFLNTVTALKNKGLLANKNTIILALANSDVEKYLDITDLEYDLIICTPNSLDVNILNKAYEAKVEIVLTPANLSFDCVIDMAIDMALEIDNAYHLNLFKDNEYIKACYDFAKKNKNQFMDFNIFIIPSNLYSVALGMYRYYNVLSDSEVYLYGNKLNDFDDISYIDDIDSFLKQNSNKKILLFEC